ncbi:hypothetical protein Tco_0396799 [Tanacetum coccineum]
MGSLNWLRVKSNYGFLRWISRAKDHEKEENKKEDNVEERKVENVQSSIVEIEDEKEDNVDIRTEEAEEEMI